MSSQKRQKRQVEVDPKGREINPYIPRFISSAPWYSAQDGDDEDYLAHQRQDPNKPIEDNSEAKPGQGIVDEVPTDSPAHAAQLIYDKSIYEKVRVFPKDACTNCGSLNHLSRECLEKPRKVTAKALMIVMHEKKAKLKNISDWDSKRDRWNGYDVEKDWDNQVNHWKEKDEKLQLKLAKEKAENVSEDELDDEEALEMAELGLVDETKGKASASVVVSVMDKPDKLPVRSREDKPSYLNNLGGEVTYNPRSRTDRSAELGYLNDRNQFVRHLNGELQEHERLKKFAWDINKDYQVDPEKVGEKLTHLDKHMEASPTLALLELKLKEEERLKQRELKKRLLLAKYGESVGEDSRKITTKMNGDDKLDHKVEVKLKKVQVETDVKEDIFPGNHSSVWGSFWKEGRWGFLCCGSLERDSECRKVEK